MVVGPRVTHTTPRAVGDAELQRESGGIEFAISDEYRTCTWSEYSVDGRDEKYQFPCPEELDCCGRTCCEPAPIMPIWLWLLLLLLLLLLLCICCGLAMYIWYKCRKKVVKTVEEKFVPSPLEESYVPAAAAITVRGHSIDEVSREQRATAGHEPNTGGQQRAHIAYYRPFVASPMEESVLPAPEPIHVRVHTADELSRPQAARTAHVQDADAKHGRAVYYRPGFDNVPAY